MSGTVRKLAALPLFDSETGPDAHLTLEWTGDELTKITKLVGEITWEKTLIWSGGYPVVISDWVKV